MVRAVDKADAMLTLSSTVIIGSHLPFLKVSDRRRNYWFPFIRPCQLKQEHWSTLLQFTKTSKRFQ